MTLALSRPNAREGKFEEIHFIANLDANKTSIAETSRPVMIAHRLRSGQSEESF